MDLAPEPDLPIASMSACQGHLRAILTHWAPTYPGPEAREAAVPESQAAGPECTAASLVACWALRSVAECPPDAAKTLGLLDWLEKHIVSQPTVVAQLLTDSAAGNGLFGLYTRLCGAEALAGPEPPRVACAFNAIMLQLLVARGLSRSPFHVAIEDLCQASLDKGQDATKRGKFEVPLKFMEGEFGVPGAQF